VLRHVWHDERLPEEALRIQAASGCCGLQFRWVLDVPQPNDVRLQIDEMELLIDPITRPYTEHLLIDYAETPYGGQFIFRQDDGRSEKLEQDAVVLDKEGLT